MTQETQWETVIGLEIHTQLATQSKIFSGASTAFGSAPNTQACAIDLGMPGVLPVLNKKAVEHAIKFGLSIQAEITEVSVFARKNYFYPDLPKGYQISQFEHPIVGKGAIDIVLEDGTEKNIGITRAHLEEDAGKSIHEEMNGSSGVDLNRAGTPLLEIVSEPDMRSAEEAIAYLKTIHRLVRYLNISDGNMQEGSFRCDVNISIRPVGQSEFGTRTELKNMNSFKFIEKAIEYEVDRQKDVLENGGTIHQETRQYDADKNITKSLRSKEAAHDYRYFPDPDLLPLHVSTSEIEAIRATLPELPWEKRDRFIKDYDLSNYDANGLIVDQQTSDFFETTVNTAGKSSAKIAANWILVNLNEALNKHDMSIAQSPISSESLGQLLIRIQDNTISNNIAKQVFEAMWNGQGTPDQIIEEKGLKQITDSNAIESIIDTILENNPNQVEQYRAGKDKLFGYFVGQVMKETRGKANPKQLNDLLKAKLDA